ncbi:hypothetical protein HN51_046955 [Arachis hypogaea]
MIGVPHLSTPPVTNTSVPGSQDTATIATKPIRMTPNFVTGLEDLSQLWTQSLNRLDGIFVRKTFVKLSL